MLREQPGSLGEAASPSEQYHALGRWEFPPMLLGCVNIGERKGDPSEMVGPQVMRRKECYQNSLQTQPRQHNGREREKKPAARARPRTVSEYCFGHRCGDAYVKEKSHG